MSDRITAKVSRRIGKIQADIINLFKTASLPNGKSILRQICEIIKLRLGPAKLKAQEYYWYNMADKEVYKGVDLSTFGGDFMTTDLHRQLNSARWDAVVTDKLIMAMVFSKVGIPQPQLYAAACRFVRDCGDYEVFSTEHELTKFIENDISYPFFCKPIKGGQAAGCNFVESYNREKNELCLAGGGSIPVAKFVDSLIDPSGWGFLFQEAVRPHPDTASICGDSVSGCRVIMLLGDEGARPFRVVWKLPARGNHVDNYVHGSTGNLLADIDLDTGCVVRVVSGSGKGLAVNPKHPDTGAEIIGMKVPDWEEMMVMLKKAASAFSGFRFQHWDVGLTSKGPIVYELNTAGEVYITELVKGSGVYDSELKAFIDMYAEEGRRSKYVGTTPVSSSGHQVA